MYGCCSKCYVVSNECGDPTSCRVQPLGGAVMYFWSFYFSGGLCFLDFNGICMSVVNKHFELLEFDFNSIYVDMRYNEIYITFTAGYVCVCGVCSHVVVLGLSVRLSMYPMWVLWLR